MDVIGEQKIDIVVSADGYVSMSDAEKREIIDSVSRLRDFKDLRNKTAYEYEADDLPGIFSAVLEAMPELFQIARRIQSYCSTYTRESDP